MMDNKSIHEQAIDHLILATGFAHEGREQEVKHHLDQAQTLCELNARKLKAQGQHQQAEKYVQSMGDHVSRVNNILSKKLVSRQSMIFSKAKEILNTLEKEDQPKACSCSSMQKKKPELAKGFDNPYLSASPARKEYMSTGSVKQTQQVGTPKGQKGYAYKPIHELHHEDQAMVQNKYQGDYGRYAYATDPQSGRLAHALTGRIPLPPGQSVRAQASSFKELKPEHKRGAAVRIDNQGHPTHGKLGIVMGPHPELPGKIAVQVGHTEAHRIYVEPHQVKLTKPVTKMEKAIVTLYNIRKAFMKSED